MKPINPYQGQAPAAMAQMGQGILEAGANIGRSIQSGYESLGKGLAGGINAAVGEYAKYKDMSSQIKASEKSYNTIKDFLDPELRKKFDTEIEGLNKDTTLSLQDKANFWDQAKGTLGGFVSQGFQMQKMQKELDNRFAIADMEQQNRLAMQESEFGMRAKLEAEKLKNDKEIAQYTAVTKALSEKNTSADSYEAPRKPSKFKLQLGGGLYQQ